MSPQKISIIGSGFSSLSAACYLAKAGYDVSIYEKNKQIGGRASQYKKEGFTFDMGPSWYWMPDIFDKFFNDFQKKTSDYYQLSKLNPAYKVYFGDNDFITIEDTLEKIMHVFEKEEKGSGKKLKKFIDKAGKNYQIAMDKIVYRPGISPLELVTPKTIQNVGAFFTNIKKEVYRNFKSPKLRQILQFPVLFLGAKPVNTPLFYNFMNYADFGIGTFHPKGGMYSVIEGIATLAKSLGVKITTDAPIDKIVVESNKVVALQTKGIKIPTDIVVSGADYSHTETLLETKYRSYSEAFWSKKTFAPSSLLFYVGLDKKIETLSHHNLFFDVDFDNHATAIYDHPKWPKEPLFYVNFPSISDDTMAPKGKENMFILIPIAVGLEDTEELREKYFNLVIDRLEERTKEPFRKHILFKKSYCVKDFISDYNSYKGNAYGLANTLSQTAFLRPKLKSKKVKNLYFTGQLTVPGPGVPPALISGKIVSDLILTKK